MKKIKYALLALPIVALTAWNQPQAAESDLNAYTETEEAQLADTPANVYYEHNGIQVRMDNMGTYYGYNYYPLTTQTTSGYLLETGSGTVMVSGGVPTVVNSEARTTNPKSNSGATPNYDNSGYKATGLYNSKYGRPTPPQLNNLEYRYDKPAHTFGDTAARYDGVNSVR